MFSTRSAIVRSTSQRVNRFSEGTKHTLKSRIIRLLRVGLAGRAGLATRRSKKIIFTYKFVVPKCFIFLGRVLLYPDSPPIFAEPLVLAKGTETLELLQKQHCLCDTDTSCICFNLHQLLLLPLVLTATY